MSGFGAFSSFGGGAPQGQSQAPTGYGGSQQQGQFGGFGASQGQQAPTGYGGSQQQGQFGGFGAGAPVSTSGFGGFGGGAPQGQQAPTGYGGGASGSSSVFVPGTSTPLGAAAAARVGFGAATQAPTGFGNAQQQTYKPTGTTMAPGGFSAAPTGSTGFGAGAPVSTSGFGAGAPVSTSGFGAGAPVSTSGFGAGAPVSTSGFGGFGASQAPTGQTAARPTSTGFGVPPATSAATVTSTGIPPQGFKPGSKYINPSNYFDLSPAFEKLPYYNESKVLMQKISALVGPGGKYGNGFQQFVEESYRQSNEANIFQVFSGFMNRYGVEGKNLVNSLKADIMASNATNKNVYGAGQAFKESFKLFMKEKLAPSSSSSAAFMNASAAARRQEDEEMAAAIRRQEEAQAQAQAQARIEEETRRRNQVLAARKEDEERQRKLQERLAAEAQEASLRSRTVEQPVPTGVPTGATSSLSTTAKPTAASFGGGKVWTPKPTSGFGAPTPTSGFGAPTPTSGFGAATTSFSGTTLVTEEARKSALFPPSTLQTSAKETFTTPPVVVSGGGDMGKQVAKLEKKINDLTSMLTLVSSSLEEHKRESQLREERLMAYLGKILDAITDLDADEEEDDASSSSSSQSTPAGSPKLSPPKAAFGESSSSRSSPPKAASPKATFDESSSSRSSSSKATFDESSTPFTDDIPRDINSLIRDTAGDIGNLLSTSGSDKEALIDEIRD